MVRDPAVTPSITQPARARASGRLQWSMGVGAESMQMASADAQLMQEGRPFPLLT